MAPTSDFSSIANTIDAEHSRITARVNELRAQLNEAESQLERLTHAKAAIEGHSITKSGRRRVSTLSPERRATRSEILRLTQKTRRSTNAKEKAELRRQRERLQEKLAELKKAEKSAAAA